MFRDPSYFRAIREKVVPHLRTYPSLKVWVAGCGSGEELYSLVILFREEGLEQRTLFYAMVAVADFEYRWAEGAAAPLERDVGRADAAIAAPHKLSTRTNPVIKRKGLKAAACECYEVVSQAFDHFSEHKQVTR